MDLGQHSYQEVVLRKTLTLNKQILKKDYSVQEAAQLMQKASKYEENEIKRT